MYHCDPLDSLLASLRCRDVREKDVRGAYESRDVRGEACVRRDVRCSHFSSCHVLLAHCRDVGGDEKVTPHAEQEAWEQHQIGGQGWGAGS